MSSGRTTSAGALLLAALLAAPLTACAGSSSSSTTGDGGAAAAPTDASTGDFCRVFSQLATLDPHAASDRLRAVGTPTGISSEARDGFVLLAVRLFVLPDGIAHADPAGVAQDLAAGDRSEVAAFLTYARDQCQVLPSM